MTARPLDTAGDALIVFRGQVIAALAAENARMAERVGDLERRLEALERLASRNSGNSSMPPSADDLPGKKPPAPKPERAERGVSRVS